MLLVVHPLPSKFLEDLALSSLSLRVELGNHSLKVDLH